ncbi:adenine phosphoribosyltransferase [Prevotella sp. OH937_COT-195]|uniref:adenine phosphoribosyltransferase n=1 Tax=Prevotella sp. OH937_COT-195 TaxID=2491051 RepID=UPI000F648088|nr:adenine phosphoribosyltransferase [Prevotella sp. OH937_COT-195]RRD00944.1 adenine phosphoribosyltransferase [Prevotella sp. OH937_COT-195]
MNNKLLMDNLRCIPDFPAKGVNFRDVTTLFKSAECLKEMVDEQYEIYKDKGITKVVGIESRGFVLASALAVRLGAGVILCRKPGKLPTETIQESYEKEYGTDTIEIHKDAISSNDVVLLHDDLLATGGTMKASCDLVKKFNPKKVYVNFIIELVNEGFEGRNIFDKDIEVSTLIQI